MIGGLSPICPIIAVTDDKKAYHKMSVYGDVLPVYMESKECGCKTVDAAIEQLKASGILETGDRLVVAGHRKDENKITLGKIIDVK